MDCTGDIVVSWIENVKKGLMNLGIEPPLELDYPELLRPYLGRNIWESMLHKIYTNPSTWPEFEGTQILFGGEKNWAIVLYTLITKRF